MHRLMSASLLVVLAIVGLAAIGSAGPKSVVPAQLARARYVCLGYDIGTGFLSEAQAISAPATVFPEDRRALDAIRAEIERWGKYTIVVQPDQADLLISVRTGRLLGTTVGVGIGSAGGRGGPGGQSTLGGVEVSSPTDLFVVYEAHGGRPGAQLWRLQRSGALAGTPPRAFEEFRTAVESAPPPTPRPSTPKK